MFFSNQSRKHTQLVHKVVREPGYESEPTDWENFFVNMTTHRMNRLENIRKEKNTHTHTHTHKELGKKMSRKIQDRSSLFNYYSTIPSQNGLWVIRDAQSDLGHVLRNLFNKWPDIIFTVRVCRRWRDVVGTNNVSIHIKVLCEEWSGLRKGLRGA